MTYENIIQFNITQLATQKKKSRGWYAGKKTKTKLKIIAQIF